MADKEVTYSLEILPEETSYLGAFASGNDADDRETEKWIKEQLDRGNEWAWCAIKVTAELNGFKGTDYLGCCSFKSKADFESSGYYDDMCVEALNDLEVRLRCEVGVGKSAAHTLALLEGK